MYSVDIANCRWSLIVISLAVAPTVPTAAASEFELNDQTFTLPNGFDIQQVAGPPLVDRPVNADFDELGRLYVTDSSGSNEHVDVQREKRPHRIVRLVDTNGDGSFDTSTVYADKLMFPEGALWHDGSLYVAAPPEIWKFTDGDDDGVAEHREVWFDGQTLTHCANDLHGPYLGPDGWFYWCKGAFAEQTYQRPGKPPLKTKAAHIFRRHPAGGPIEAVMTGGMDNPVEIAFTRSGERIFTTTFLVHPHGGRRDGLIHAIYGGVYGKDHGAINGHPRTGDLMPVLAHLGVAAPCGLTRLESAGLGAGFRDSLLATSFNLHKVTRHALNPTGSSFDCRTTDFLLSDNLDFHPTDVLEDADGSVIVVDTGGWFRLCCPTSQLEKPDVLGAIYRIRRTDAPSIGDPRGLDIDWNGLTASNLVRLLADARPAARARARRTAVKLAEAAIESLNDVTQSATNVEQRLQAVWALTAIDHPQARAAVRTALEDDAEQVRLAALHSISLHRDTAVIDRLHEQLQAASSHQRRVAAEALGRIGNARSIAPLMSAVGDSNDRHLQHALIYALIEIGDDAELRQYIASPNHFARRAALIALDQMLGGSRLSADDIAPLLTSSNKELHDTGWWIAEQHPEWGDVAVDALRQKLADTPADSEQLSQLQERLQKFSGTQDVQTLMAETLMRSESAAAVHQCIIAAMADSGRRPLPPNWEFALRRQIEQGRELVPQALSALASFPADPLQPETLDLLSRIASTGNQFDAASRLQAISLLPPQQRIRSPQAFELVCDSLTVEHPVNQRALAVEIITTTPLSEDNREQIASVLPSVGPMELPQLFDLLTRDSDPELGAMVVESLSKAPAATVLGEEKLAQALTHFGPAVAARAAPLLRRIEQENRDKVQQINDILALMPEADMRRGLRVFQSSEAACIACHRRAYLGGDIGPDLTGIGQARSERDLLESILYPSLTFVRNYEPAAVLTTDGQIYNGVVRQETADEITLQLDATKTTTIAKDEIEETRFSEVSIMPAGLDKQLTKQQLADLVKYLKEG